MFLLIKFKIIYGYNISGWKTWTTWHIFIFPWLKMLFYAPTEGVKIHKCVSLLGVKIRVHSNIKLMQKSSIAAEDLVWNQKYLPIKTCSFSQLWDRVTNKSKVLEILGFVRLCGQSLIESVINYERPRPAGSNKWASGYQVSVFGIEMTVNAYCCYLFIIKKSFYFWKCSIKFRNKYFLSIQCSTGTFF